MSKDSVIKWMHAFSDCVRREDYLGGKALFSPCVISFGSWTEEMHGIEELYAKQWSNVWPVTTSFEFDFTSANYLFDKPCPITQCVVTSIWSSKGLEVSKQPKRSGRCTIVLNKDGDVWRAVHTHFSLTPNGEL